MAGGHINAYVVIAEKYLRRLRSNIIQITSHVLKTELIRTHSLIQNFEIA